MYGLVYALSSKSADGDAYPEIFVGWIRNDLHGKRMCDDHHTISAMAQTGTFRVPGFNEAFSEQEWMRK